MFHSRVLPSLLVLSFTIPCAIAQGPNEVLHYKGCFSSAIASSFQSLGYNAFQSVGNCESKCSYNGFSVYALTDGDMCSCGNSIPPSSDLVNESQCDIACAGWPAEKCGGMNSYSVWFSDVSGSGNVSSVSDSTATATQPSSVTSSAVETTSYADTIPSSIGSRTATSPAAAATTASASTTKAPSSSVTTLAQTSMSSETATASPSSSTGAASDIQAHVGLGIIAGLIAIIPQL